MRTSEEQQLPGQQFYSVINILCGIRLRNFVNNKWFTPELNHTESKYKLRLGVCCCCFLFVLFFCLAQIGPNFCGP